MQTTSSFEKFQTTQYFQSLDGIRALSILAVVWHHTISGYFSDAPLLRSGHFGVALFFVISGFLITTLLLREKSRTGHVSIRNFMIRRSLRIFPLYYTVLGIYALLVYKFEQDPVAAAGFWQNLPFFLTYTSNLFVHQTGGRVIFFFAWSLAVEEQFYLIWSWVEKLCSPKVIALIIGLGLSVLIFYGNESFVCILLGVALAHLLGKRRTFDALYGIFGRSYSSAVFLLLFIGTLSVQVNSYLVYFSMVAFIASCVIRETHSLHRVLTLRPLVSIGVASYGMYLFHLMSYRAVEKLFTRLNYNHHVVVFAVSLALTYALAMLSHRYYESLFLKLKVKWIRG